MTTEEFESTIKNFVDKYNNNLKIQNMLKKWNAELLIWSKDDNAGFIIKVENGKVVDISKSTSFNEGRIKVVGERRILIDMFKGLKNPSQLYLNGIIEVYGPERDQIILDRIVEEIWG
jgi:hypothetical protein